MGKPATAYFCKKGHLVAFNAAGVFGELDDLYSQEDMIASIGLTGEMMPEWPNCQVCGGALIKKPVSGWQNNEECTSSIVKVREEIFARITPSGVISEYPIGVYDVSSILHCSI